MPGVGCDPWQEYHHPLLRILFFLLSDIGHANGAASILLPRFFINGIVKDLVYNRLMVTKTIGRRLVSL